MTLAAKIGNLPKFEAVSEWEYPVSASTLCKGGDYAMITATGVKSVDGVAANGPFIGLFPKTYDNSAGAAGAVRAVVRFARTFACVWIPLSATAKPTVANIWQTVYLNASSQLCTTNTSQAAGKLIGISKDGTKGLVALDP